MTASVRILTTRTVDSSPAILLVDPDGTKTLINCGEGCQRSFLEHSQKLSSVHRVCLTHLSHDAVGGLPGMILTSADAAMQTEVHQMAVRAGVAAPEAANPNGSTLSLSGLELVGPQGTSHYVRALRHFLKRDNFPLTIRQGKYFQAGAPNQIELISKKRTNKKKRKRQESSADAKKEEPPSYFGVQTIPLAHKIPHKNQTAQVLSFVFTTPPVPGKFLPQKASELGIPKGPLYAQLKAGKDVTFTNKEGKEQTVQSSEVVLEPTPGVIVAVLYYPTIEVWKDLQPPLDDILATAQQGDAKSRTQLELVIHLTSKEVLEDPICKEWRQKLGTATTSAASAAESGKVQHVFMETSDPAVWSPIQLSPSPFISACTDALVRSKISASVYKTPDYLQEENTSSTGDIPQVQPQETEEAEMRLAIPRLKYTLLPRSKKRFQEGDPPQTNTMARDLAERKAEGMDFLKTSGALQTAQQILAAGDDDDEENKDKKNESHAELLFTGTGSAIPCKHRNVTGMHLRMDNKQSLLLDVGEGTVGQLLRAASSPNKDASSQEDLLTNIKAVWVSHPHADHHLGLLRLLTDRQAVLEERKPQKPDPLLVIGPPPILEFLREYEHVDPRIVSSYEAVDCRCLQHSPHDPQQVPRAVQENSLLGGNYIEAIRVTHCPHSYAVVLDGTSFGRVAWSGDCRPSMKFAERAKGADLLIHEATFEVGMEAEASMKRHSTVGEALNVAKQMEAKHLVLTHFSQRYPTVPPLALGGSDDDAPKMPVIFAFDYMGLTPSNLKEASKLTPALRCLYPEKGIAAEANPESAAMSVPGFFATNPY